MAGHRSWNANADKILSTPGARARIDGYKQAIEVATALSDVRDSLGLTQTQLAERLQVKQPNVSRIEHVDDPHISTLIEYSRALGGTLRLDFIFGDKIVQLDADAIASPKLEMTGTLRSVLGFDDDVDSANALADLHYARPQYEAKGVTTHVTEGRAARHPSRKR